MRVLVTGGGGFIGSHVCRELIRRGNDVRSVDIVKPRATVQGVEYMIGTVLDQYLMSRLMIGCDVVIHLAAVMGVDRCSKFPLTCLNVNVCGTQRVLDAAVARNVPHVLIASSSEVFGSAEGSMTEEFPLNPKSEYAVSKLTAEEFSKAYQRDYGVKSTITRFFSIYGPGQVGQFVMSRFAKAVQRDLGIRVYGDGSQVRAFCYVSDAAWVVCELATKGIEGTFNVGNDAEPITMLELAAKFWNVAGYAPKIEMESFEHTDRSKDREIFLRQPDVSKLRRTLKYDPQVDLQEGIAKLLECKDIPDTWADSEIPEASAAA